MKENQTLWYAVDETGDACFYKNKPKRLLNVWDGADCEFVGDLLQQHLPVLTWADEPIQVRVTPVRKRTLAETLTGNIAIDHLNAISEAILDAIKSANKKIDTESLQNMYVEFSSPGVGATTRVLSIWADGLEVCKCRYNVEA